MKALIGSLIFAVLITSLCGSVLAEMRVWTDADGKTIEAEHVRTLSDKVVLKLEDGSEIRVSLDKLDKQDRRYAILQTPPRIDITVSPKIDRENIGYSRDFGGGVQAQSETVQATVNVRKSSPAPYEAPLKSELYLIGQPERADGYVILGRTSSKFKFTAENENKHSYSSDAISLTQVEAGRQAGIEYEGYIAVVKDRTGSILSMKCSKLDFEKNAEAIMGTERGTLLDNDFNAVDRSEVRRDRDEKKEKIRKKFPGRRF
jgi:hypothetical protein